MASIIPFIHRKIYPKYELISSKPKREISKQNKQFLDVKLASGIPS
ncbi:hypothetical protein CHCC20335_2317 [Bacillus paralicheniformis]|nr:hypothetical protein CHCC20335_2317 [Bacillus paralicheniformis]